MFLDVISVLKSYSPPIAGQLVASAVVTNRAGAICGSGGPGVLGS